MPSDTKLDAGLQLFNEILHRTGSLEMREARRFNDIRSFFIRIGPERGSGSKNSTIVLSEDFLADLPSTPGYVPSAAAYARSWAGRMANADPVSFFCTAGVPIRVEIDWPMRPFANRAATYLPVSVWNLRRAGTMARCTMTITFADYDIGLEKNPFRLEVYIISTVRRAVDGGELDFVPMANLPATRKELSLDVRVRPDTPEKRIDRFISGKVYWMGFRQGDKRTKVWIADDWDADYLGVTTSSLIQSAQILEAQKMLVLDSGQQYASAGDALLAQSANFEAEPLSVNVGESLREDRVGPQEWDAFICHASEDKDDFVRPLVEALRQAGLKVWYDEFTLRVGDSLRRAIDRGLGNSRFGIVVLSPAFFRKEWPQKELDGLTAKEIDGRKVILPVWHNVTVADVRKYSLTLADKVAADSRKGIPDVVAKLVAGINE